jgi:hypothetical protein
MKRKLFLIVIILTIFSSGLFAENPEGQILQFNEKANEEIIVINQSYRKDAFKISVHTTDGSAFHMNAFSVNVTKSEEGWIFLTKTPDIRSGEKWKSSSDFEIMELSDYICIESKSGNKYNYNFETKHDKLYITVSPYKEGDDW